MNGPSYMTPAASGDSPPGPDSSSPVKLLPWAMPILLHRLANQTQWMTGLRALAEMEDGDRWLEAKSEELNRGGRSLQVIGWLMAVLGSGAGNNLLLARREPQGLDWMVELVQEGLQREWRQRANGPSQWPALNPSAHDGWQIPCLVAQFLVAAYGSGTQFANPFAWQWVNDFLEIDAPRPESKLEPSVLEAFSWLPGVRVEALSGGLRLHMPREWFTPTP